MSMKNLIEGSGTKMAVLSESLSQYTTTGEVIRPTIDTIKSIEPGIYKMEQDMRGIYFEKHNIITDAILRFKDSRYNKILEEIDKFWEMGEDFAETGFTHKRGIMLYGAPGCGKSCLIKLVAENMVKRGDVVFIATDPGTLSYGLKEFKAVEPKRQCLVIMEDVDSIIQYGERRVLELFDGSDQTNGVLFLGTTNYIANLPPRVLRPGRFDRKIEVKSPPLEGRLAFLQEKIGKKESAERIQDLAEKTDGFSFGQLREFVVSAYLYKYNAEDTIERIRKGLEVLAEGKKDESKLKKNLSLGTLLESGYKENHHHEEEDPRVKELHDRLVAIYATGATPDGGVKAMMLNQAPLNLEYPPNMVEKAMNWVKREMMKNTK
jgi:SpoVK/Ycf46/Vps4 family AAA+-type ATPase